MDTPPLTVPQPEPPSPPMSLWARLLNMLATPGEVFDSLRPAPVSHANWLMPAILLLAVGVIGGLFVLSQDTVEQQMREITAAAMEKQFAKMNLPPEQMERAREQGEMFGSIGMKASVFFAPIMVGFVSPFVWGLFLWLIGTKLLKGNFDYLKGVEAAGLSNMVAVLETAVRYLLVVVTGNFFASPGLGLLVKEYDVNNPLHTLLLLGNVIVFWLIAVRGVALARLSRASTGKCILLAFAFWAAYTLLMVAPSVLVQMLTQK